MSTTRSSSRRVKWLPTPPPPSPKIINLPRRQTSRRRKPKHHTPATTATGVLINYKGKIESLFSVEREFARDRLVMSERRERVEPEEAAEADDAGGRLAEEKWKFQAEILRAECNYLRMERKFALKKLEKNRIRIEKTLKSALQNLASGRKRLCEGKDMEVMLEEEIRELGEKLKELQGSCNGSDYSEIKKCKNFDKKAKRLQRRLEKLGGLQGDEHKKEMKNETSFNDQCNEISSSILECKIQPKSNDVEMLERKMEGLSKGVLDVMMEKEYGSIINSLVVSSASTSKRIDFPDHLSFSNRFTNHTKEPMEANNKCSGRCKVLVRRVMEQVRAETEQWTQMQEMLGQLRQEMEELQTSKDFWEGQALASNNQIQSLQSDVEEWREKAIEYETKANKLETEVVLVKGELEKLKKDEIISTPKKTLLPLGKQIEKEAKIGLSCRMKGQCDVIDSNRHEKVEQSKKDTQQPLSLGKQLAKEKRILISRLKENRRRDNETSIEGRRKGYNYLVRSPFKDIGNSSSNSNAVYPLH